MCRDSCRALNLAAKSRSDCWLWRVWSEGRGRRERRTLRERESVTTEDRDEDESDESEESSLCRAHLEIACSTTAAMAVNRPPEREEDADDDVEVEMDTGLAGLGGGSPRKISESPPMSSSSEPRRLSAKGCRMGWGSSSKRAPLGISWNSMWIRIRLPVLELSGR